MTLSGKCVIAGIGATAFGKHPGRSSVSLNVEAIREALADAGVEKGQVDRRTNYYTLTRRGQREIEARREWESQYVSDKESAELAD